MGKKLTLENSLGGSKPPADGLERGDASRGPVIFLSREGRDLGVAFQAPVVGVG